MIACLAAVALLAASALVPARAPVAVRVRRHRGIAAQGPAFIQVC